MKISMIAAMDRNNAIGRDNDIPWMGKLPADMSFFIRNTKQKPVIMGRKTFDSIGRPLPNRLNIVISRNTNLMIEGAIVVSSLDEALAASGDAEEIMIIGGSKIYSEGLRVANRLYITEIDTLVLNADAFFPKITSEWKLIESEKCLADKDNKFNYSFNIYER